MAAGQQVQGQALTVGAGPLAPGEAPLSVRALRLAEMVKLQEVAFSLPLAYAGALMGARGWPGLGTWIWITAAVAGGKIGGMALNRLIDRDIDAHNPETAGRHLPAGLVSPRAALVVGIIGLAVLSLSAFALGPLCAAFLPVVLGLLVVYSYTKRWGWGCHFALASIGFFLPAAGWVAVTGRLGPGPLLFGAATGLWYVGFDSLYALRDVVSDRQQGVHSLPADLGVPNTLRIAQAAHLGVVVLLLALLWQAALPWPFGLAVIATAVVLFAQQASVARALRPVGFARFNSAVALLLLFGALGSILTGWGG